MSLEVFDSVLGLNRWFRAVLEMSTRSLCFDSENSIGNTLQGGCLHHNYDALKTDALRIIPELLPDRITVSPNTKLFIM